MITEGKIVKKDTLHFINISYVIGTVLVVFGHSFPTEMEMISPLMYELRGFLYEFHMPLFFFISGFLMQYTETVSKKGFGKYIKDRAVQLIIPYLFLTLLFYLPKNYLMGDEISLNAFVNNLISPRYNILGHLWYLPVLFLISVIFSVLSFIRLKPGSFSKKALTATKIIIAVITLALTLSEIRLDLFGISDIFKFSIYFYFGILLVKPIIENKNKFKKPYFLVTEVVLSVLFYCLRRTVFIDNIFLYRALTVVTAFLMIFFIFGISMALEFSKLGKIEKLSAYSFTVYLYSWPVQTVVLYLGINVLKLPNYIVCPCMFVLGLTVPMVISLVYSKIKFINNKLFDIFLGIKVKIK